MSIATKTTLTKVKSVPVLFDVFTKAKFAKLNKQDCLAAYEWEVASGDYHEDKIKIVEIVNLTAKQYDEFVESLLEDFDWLEGKGGTDSTAIVAFDGPIWNAPDDVRKARMAGSYRVCLAIQCKGKKTFYVDPQGYKYARYVGI